MPLAAVRPSDLDVLVKTLAGKLAASTVEGVYRLAATVFKSAIRDRLVTTTPCVDVRLPEKPRREVVPLTVEQVAELADLVPARYRGLIVLGAGCGLRLSEAVGVTVDRVNFLGRMVTVDRQLVTPPKGEPRFGPPKRAASNRMVPLPIVVADVLAFHLQKFGEGPDGLIFTNDRGLPIRRNGFSPIF
jgi:integrase